MPTILTITRNRYTCSKEGCKEYLDNRIPGIQAYAKGTLTLRLIYAIWLGYLQKLHIGYIAEGYNISPKSVQRSNQIFTSKVRLNIYKKLSTNKVTDAEIHTERILCDGRPIVAIFVRDTETKNFKLSTILEDESTLNLSFHDLTLNKLNLSFLKPFIMKAHSKELFLHDIDLYLIYALNLPRDRRHLLMKINSIIYRLFRHRNQSNNYEALLQYLSKLTSITILSDTNKINKHRLMFKFYLNPPNFEIPYGRTTRLARDIFSLINTLGNSIIFEEPYIYQPRQWSVEQAYVTESNPEDSASYRPLKSIKDIFLYENEATQVLAVHRKDPRLPIECFLQLNECISSFDEYTPIPLCSTRLNGQCTLSNCPIQNLHVTLDQFIEFYIHSPIH